MLESDFDDGASSDFAPPAKPAKVAKAKAPAPKKAAGAAKPRGRPAKDPNAPPKPKAAPKAKAAPKKKRKDDSDVENSDLDMQDDAGDALDEDDDESLLADTPPKQKKAPATKKSSGKPLANIANESFDMMDGIEDAASSGKAAAGGASSKYQMVSLPSNLVRVQVNSLAAYPFGTHHEASRHIYWLCRANLRQNVGVQLEHRGHGVSRGLLRAWSLQDLRRDSC